MAKTIDYDKLRSLYGRLMGLSESLPDKGSNFDSIIANDYNSILTELANITETNLEAYKIPYNQYYQYEGMHSQYVHGSSATRISQFISYLRYTYNLDERILEIGSLINAIENQELKNRCLDLLTAKSNFDRVINQSTQVLEDTNRQKSGIVDKYGVDLINAVFKESPLESILIIDGEPEEHQGFGHICRGIMLGFRNLTHHKLIDKFSREDAFRFCGFIDVLLKYINSAKVNN
jgi:hypothetical protein